jgi:hypothetical protein
MRVSTVDFGLAKSRARLPSNAGGFSAAALPATLRVLAL